MLTDTQVSRLCKVFVNGSAPNIKFSKTQLSKIVQFFLPDPVGLLCSFPPLNTINSVATSYKKELKNTDPNELNGNLIIDTRLNIIGKKLKKDFHQLRIHG